jgi:hypothetical protein
MIARNYSGSRTRSRRSVNLAPAEPWFGTRILFGHALNSADGVLELSRFGVMRQ